MRYSYKFWSKIMNPLNYLTMIFGWHICFVYNEDIERSNLEIFESFDGFSIKHSSSFDEL